MAGRRGWIAGACRLLGRVGRLHFRSTFTCSLTLNTDCLHSTCAEYATGYKLHVYNNDGTAVQNGGTNLVVVLPVTGGAGTKTHSLTAGELGSPTGAATFKFKASGSQTMHMQCG